MDSKVKWFTVVLVASLLAGIECAPSSEQSDHKKQEDAMPDVEERIDAFVEAVRQCTDTPGLTLGIVRDGQPWLAKGYGIKDVDSQEAVTNRTLFLVASVTKALAATITSMVLEDHDGFDLDTPIRDILGENFHLHDPYRALHVNFRDCFGHRHGMNGHDEMRVYGYSPDEMIWRMQYLPFPLAFRDEYLYQNLFYGVATRAIEVLEDNVPWEQLITERLFQPLGMDDTTFVHLAEDRWDEFVRGHQLDDDDEWRTISLEYSKLRYGSMSSMGSIASNAVDMTKWLAAQINEGRSEDGTQVISEDVMQETHRPVNVNPYTEIWRSPDYPVSISLQKYALGWNEGLYRGYDMSEHGGSLASVISKLSFLPRAGHGVFVSTNRGSQDGDIRNYITMFTYDLLLGIEPWFDEDYVCNNLQSMKKRDEPIGFADTVASMPGRIQRLVKENMKKAGVYKLGRGIGDSQKVNDRVFLKKTRAQVEEYTGLFGNYAYGNLTFYINEEDEHLYMSYGTNSIYDLGDESIGDVFQAQGTDINWHLQYIVSFQREEGDISSVIVSFDFWTPPQFDKSIDWNNPPPPPELCPED